MRLLARVSAAAVRLKKHARHSFTKWLVMPVGGLTSLQTGLRLCEVTDLTRRREIALGLPRGAVAFLRTALSWDVLKTSSRTGPCERAIDRERPKCRRRVVRQRYQKSGAAKRGLDGIRRAAWQTTGADSSGSARNRGRDGDLCVRRLTCRAARTALMWMGGPAGATGRIVPK